MSRDPESGELKTIVNMTPGQLGVMSQPLSNPMQYQSFDPAHPGPYVIQQGYPVRFEVSHENNETKAQELTKQLDQGWYLCYKYLMVVIAIMDVFGLLNSLNLLFGSQRNDVSVFVTLFGIFVTVWDIYQLYTIYQAINLKDLKLAQKAVTMMQICMVLLAVGSIIQLNQMTDSMRRLDGTKLSGGEYVLTFVFTIALVEGLFCLVYYIGASKVKEILAQISALRRANAGFSQLPDAY